MSKDRLPEEQAYPGFPKSFLVCPCCGSLDSVMETVAQEERDKGHVRKEGRSALQVIQAGVVDPTHQKIIGTKIPMITVMADVCGKCGAIYAKQIERGEVSLKPQMGPMPPQPPQLFGGN